MLKHGTITHWLIIRPVHSASTGLRLSHEERIHAGRSHLPHIPKAEGISRNDHDHGLNASNSAIEVVGCVLNATQFPPATSAPASCYIRLKVQQLIIIINDSAPCGVGEVP
jgi:hypothetical protein